MSEDIYGRRGGGGRLGSGSGMSKRSSVRRSVASRGGRLGKGGLKTKKNLMQRMQQGRMPISPMAEAFDSGYESGYEDLSSGYEPTEEGIMPGSGLDIDALAEQVSEQVVQEGIFGALDDELDTEELFGSDIELTNLVPHIPSLGKKMAASMARKQATVSAERELNLEVAEIDAEIDALMDEPSSEIQRQQLLKLLEKRDRVAYRGHDEDKFGATTIDEVDRVIRLIHSKPSTRENLKSLEDYMRLRESMILARVDSVNMTREIFDAWKDLDQASSFLGDTERILNRPGPITGSDRSDAIRKVALAVHNINKTRISILKGELDSRRAQYGGIHHTAPVYSPRYHDSETERYGEDSSKPGTFTESLKMGAGLGLGVLAVVAGVGLVAKAVS